MAILLPEQAKGAKKVLNAAAMTYVAALSSIAAQFAQIDTSFKEKKAIK